MGTTVRVRIIEELGAARIISHMLDNKNDHEIVTFFYLFQIIVNHTNLQSDKKSEDFSV